MKILLISVNKEQEPYPVYPLGMGVVAKVLEKNGHTTVQKDCLANGENEILNHIRNNDYDLIGLSIRNIDNVDSLTENSHWSIGTVKNFTEKIRDITNTRIFIGGAGFSIMPEKIMSFTKADYGIAGECEKAILDMIAAIKNGCRRGTVFSSVPEKIEGAKIDPEIAGYYANKSGIMNIQTKRGCPYRCSYCTYPMLEGRKIRPRQVDEVINDIEELKKIQGMEEIFFTDSVFNDPKGYWLELAEKIVLKNLKIKWSAFFEPASITDKELRLCALSGLKSIELGTDATTDETLNGLNKPFTMNEVFNFDRLCVKEKIPVAHFVIFGGPGETRETLKKGVENLKKMPHSIMFGFLGVRVYKSTGVYARGLSEGLFTEKDDMLKPFYYFSPLIDKNETEIYLTRSFKGDRTRLFPPSKGQEFMSVALNFGHRGTLWDKLIRY